jgi:hypothetical protein
MFQNVEVVAIVIRLVIIDKKKKKKKKRASTIEKLFFWQTSISFPFLDSSRSLQMYIPFLYASRFLC